MNKVRKTGLMKVATTIGKVVASHRGLTIMALAAAALLPASRAVAVNTVLDLTGAGAGFVGSLTSQQINNTPGVPVGSLVTAYFATSETIPTGTGVFDPFLTIQSPGGPKTPLEQGYNTTTVNQTLPFDDLRNHWNKDIQKQDLGIKTFFPGNKAGVAAGDYYEFVLDANEPGNDPNRYLSIDNIQLYNNATGHQTTTGTDANGNLLVGTLRYSLNDPRTLSLTPANNWVKIDATRNRPDQVTSGSGSDDLQVFIPVGVLAGVAGTDFIYFYNQDGYHFEADSGTGAEAGFEEWRVLKGQVTVPDAGGTLVLLGLGLTTLGFFGGRRKV